MADNIWQKNANQQWGTNKTLNEQSAPTIKQAQGVPVNNTPDVVVPQPVKVVYDNNGLGQRVAVPVGNPSVPPRDTQVQNQNGAETQAPRYNGTTNQVGTPQKKANGSTPDNAQQLVNDEAATYMGGGTGTEQPAPNVANAFIQTQANDVWAKGNNAYNQQFNGDATGAWGTAKTMNEQQKLNIQQAQGMPLFQGQKAGAVASDPRLSGGVSVMPQTLEDVQGKVSAGAPIDTNNIQQKQQPVTSTDIFKQYFQDEEKERKASKQRAMVGAIGDALRNIGNLYYTTQGATPQTIGVNSAAEEANKYQTDKGNRQNMAYKYYTQKQNNDIAKAEAERKNALNGANIKYKDAQTNKILQDMKIDAEKYPYEMKNLIAEAAYKSAQADKEGADAALSQINAYLKKTYGEQEAKLKLGEIQSQINAHNASAESSRASAANSYAMAKYHNANTKKTMQEIAEGNKPLSFSGYYGVMRRKTKGELSDDQITSIYAKAKTKGWITGNEYKAYIDGGVDSKHAMIAAISDALQIGNDKQRQDFTHYLVDNYGFSVDPSRQKNYDYASKGIKERDTKEAVKQKRVASRGTHSNVRHIKAS